MASCAVTACAVAACAASGTLTAARAAADRAIAAKRVTLMAVPFREVGVRHKLQTSQRCGWLGLVWLGLVGEEQTVPGVGEEALVALRGPAALADQQLIELGGVRGPDDVGGLVGVQAQRVDGGQVGDEAAHVRGAAFGDLVPQLG